MTSLTEFNDTFVDGGTTYYYAITAVNGVGGSSYSTEVNITALAPVDSQVPSSPTNLQATAGVEYIYLTWDAPADNGGSPIVGYRVYRGEVSGIYDLILMTTSTELNDTLVYGGTTYYYTVVALNGIGESQYSNEVSGLPTARSPSIILLTTSTSLNPASSIDLSINTSRFSYLDTVLISWDGACDVILNYPWTVVAPDIPGQHTLRVYANTTVGSETIISFQFSIVGDGSPTTPTTPTTTTTSEPSDAPGWSVAILLLSFLVLIPLRRRN